MLRARSAQPAPGLPCQGHLLRGEGVLLSSPCSAVPQPSALRRGLCLLQGRAFLYLAQRPCSQWLNQNLFFLHAVTNGSYKPRHRIKTDLGSR